MMEHKFKIFTSPIDTKSIMKQVDGSIIIPGYFTSDRKDEGGDIIERSGTERAIEKYRRWGNVRYMHQPRPVGKVVKIGETDGLEWNQAHIHVIDPGAVFDVENGLLSALSVGIYFTWDDFEWLEDGGMLIHNYLLAEISLVDHPANYDASLSAMLKSMANSMGMQLVPQEDIMEETDQENVALENAINIEHDEELPETGQEALLETDQEESAEVDQEVALETEQEASQEEAEEPIEIKTVVPYSDTGKADKGESWSKPSLGDFTDESFENLSAGDRRRIARHYTWSANMPPETFGDLKLPHHKAATSGVGPAVWRGVAAAMARLRQSATQIPSGDKDGCYNHLAKHYRQFDEEPPEKDAPLTDMELELLAEYDPMTVEDNTEEGEEVMQIEDDAPVTEEKHQPDPLDELRQEVRSIRSALEIVEKALKEGRPDESKQDEVAELRQQLDAALAENKTLREELEVLRTPAERKGKVQETDPIPEPEAEIEEDVENVPQPGESKLRFAVRRHLETQGRHA